MNLTPENKFTLYLSIAIQSKTETAKENMESKELAKVILGKILTSLSEESLKSLKGHPARNFLTGRAMLASFEVDGCA